MGHITYLPADRCVYNISGRCLAGLGENSARHAKWRCRIVNLWERAFDDYLLQVDQFDIDPDTAARIWTRRLEKIVDRPRCPSFTPGGDETVGCALAFEDLCLKKIPPCKGRCRRYREEKGGEAE